MTIEEKRRELFEAWLKKSKPRVAQDMLDDDDFVVRWMFEAYCAALDAVVLPASEDDADGDRFAQGFNHALEEIQSTGLGLKVKQ